MHIPGFTHPVEDFMLEDVLDMTGYIPPKKKKKTQFSRGGGRDRNYQNPSFVDGDDFGDGEETSSSMPMTTCPVSLEERLKRINENEIDYDLIAVLIKELLRCKKDDGSILVFLPGAGEIDRAERVIRQVVKDSIAILPLHGGLQPEKQQQVFVPARKGFTKIILSTNVAEVSAQYLYRSLILHPCMS